MERDQSTASGTGGDTSTCGADHTGDNTGSPFIPAGEPRRSLRLSVIEGSFATVHIAITNSSLITAYALHHQASDFDLGFLAALTNIATTGSIISAQLLRRYGGRRRLTVWAATLGRVIWFPLCLAPWIPFQSGTQLAIFFAVVFLGNFGINIANNAWLSWMSDLVPPHRRGRYFGIRNTILGIVTMVITYGTGLLFDYCRACQQESLGFSLIFGVAVVSAIVAGIILNRQWEPPGQRDQVLPLLTFFLLPIRHRQFRFLLLFFLLWSIITGVAAPFYVAHMITNLGMSFSVIAFYSIITGVMNLLTLPAWGKIIDRVGNKPVLSFTILPLITLPALWLFATPAFYLPLWIDAFLSGIFWPGFTLAAFNLVLHTAPRDNRAAYFSVHSMVTGFSLLFASLLGGLLAQWYGKLVFPIGPLQLLNFHFLFILSSSARLLMFPLSLKLAEDNARSLGTLLHLVGDKVSHQFTRPATAIFLSTRKK